MASISIWISIVSTISIWINFFWIMGCLDPALMYHHPPLLLLMCHCFLHLHRKFTIEAVHFFPSYDHHWNLKRKPKTCHKTDFLTDVVFMVKNVPVWDICPIWITYRENIFHLLSARCWWMETITKSEDRVWRIWVDRGVLAAHCCLINMVKSKQVVLLPLRLTDYATSMHI